MKTIKSAEEILDKYLRYANIPPLYMTDIKDAMEAYHSQFSNEVGDDYKQKLFNYMKDEHGVTLLDSDFNEIENIINPKKYPYKMWDKVNDDELLPEEKDMIQTWRSAKDSVREGDFKKADERIDFCKMLLGNSGDYLNNNQ